jgi:hypothetical protein
VLDPACARPSGSGPSANQHHSWPVLDAALKSAVVYPLASLLVQWGDHRRRHRHWCKHTSWRRRPQLDTGHGDMRCNRCGGCAICGIGQSYGITLGLIRVRRRKHNFLTAIILIADGIAAVALLIGLGLALCGTVALINHLAGQNYIALRPIFDDLKTPKGRMGYSWLIWALLSTLMPTLVHLVLVFLSAFT